MKLKFGLASKFHAKPKEIHPRLARISSTNSFIHYEQQMFHTTSIYNQIRFIELQDIAHHVSARHPKRKEFSILLYYLSLHHSSNSPFTTVLSIIIFRFRISPGTSVRLIQFLNIQLYRHHQSNSPFALALQIESLPLSSSLQTGARRL